MQEKQYEAAIKQLQQLEREEAQEYTAYNRLQCLVQSLYEEQNNLVGEVDELISRCQKLELEIEDKDENMKKNPLELVRSFFSPISKRTKTIFHNLLRMLAPLNSNCLYLSTGNSENRVEQYWGRNRKSDFRAKRSEPGT